MKPKLWLLLLVLSLSCAQMVGQTPVCITLAKGQDEGVAGRFKAAIEKNITLSDRFVVWKNAPYDVPKNGVLVNMIAIPISTGRAIVLIAQLPSPTERGYFKTMVTDFYTFGENAPVADEALDYLTDLRKRLAAK